MICLNYKSANCKNKIRLKLNFTLTYRLLWAGIIPINIATSNCYDKQWKTIKQFDASSLLKTNPRSFAIAPSPAQTTFGRPLLLKLAPSLPITSLLPTKKKGFYSACSLLCIPIKLQPPKLIPHQHQTYQTHPCCLIRVCVHQSCSNTSHKHAIKWLASTASECQFLPAISF